MNATASLSRLRRFSIITTAFFLVVGYGPTALCSPTGGVPAFAVSAPNGQQSILLGSLHVGIAGLLEPAPSAFDGLKRLVLEHPGVYTPKLTSQAARLSEKELKEYLRRAACAGVPEGFAIKVLENPSEPHANVIAYSVCDSTKSVDSRDLLANRWANERSPLIEKLYLESDEWVATQRLKTSSALAESSLRWILQRRPEEVLAKARDAINAADYDGLQRLWLETTGSQALAAEFLQHMVIERNVAWMSPLRHAFDQGNSLVLVGAMHLPGDDGLIQLLRDAGYVVREIRLTAQQ